MQQHVENSAGLKNPLSPESSVARVGLHLYGVGDKALAPVSRWTAQVYQVRELKKGEAAKGLQALEQRQRDQAPRDSGKRKKHSADDDRVTLCNPTCEPKVNHRRQNQ